MELEINIGQDIPGEPRHPQNDIKIEFIKMLVDSAIHSLRRVRWVFSAVLFATASIFAGMWNLYFSWLRTIFLHTDAISKIPPSEACKSLLGYWIDSSFLTFPILGVRISISDAAIILSGSLAVLIIWLFFSVRRENHLIGKALRLTRKADKISKLYIYYGISFASVFLTMSEHDEPIRQLDYRETEGSVFGIRQLVRLFFYFPSISIFTIVNIDVLTLFVIPSPFRSFYSPVGFSNLQPGDWVLAVLMEIFAISMGIICAFLGNRCRQYQDGTMMLLREYAKSIYEPDQVDLNSDIIG
jgi:hypothetical protein